uniref:Uncharacterized protein n=1 Tax=Nelumbo nucifera TaxID=4432 RepID=A0A822YD09_NELNU|nr:TPA_asm: hypothetical protein HUJ06_030333 [Nelumbo nucifera]
MANRKLDSLGLGPKALEPKGRPAGVTESSWCRGVVGGTGITVLALLLSKAPDVSALQTALHRLQTSHPILRSKLSHDAATNTFSFIIPSTSHLQLESFDATSTSHLLKRLPTSASDHLVSPFHRILEHELNRNPWSSSKQEHHKHPDTAVFFASLYALPDNNWVLALRLHTSVCDRTSAVTLLRELLVVAKEVKEGQLKGEQGKRGEFNVAIEELVPRGKANKTLWAHGVDLLAYSLKSLRFSNMDFKDSIAPRSSEVVRLQMKPDETRRLVAACEARGIKLCGALAAAGLMAAHLSKNLRDHQREKYAVATLMDCRSLLEPPLQSCNLGKHLSLGSDVLVQSSRRSKFT